MEGARRELTTRERPIFLVGCPRSGTTLLQLMLHAHPRLAVPPENRYVLPAYERRTEWGDLTEAANRARLADFITGKRTLFRDFGLDAEAVRARIVAGPPSLGSALELVMIGFAEKHGAARWCDKRPMYIRHIPALRRMFPDAQFIHLVRDGRSCAASLVRMPWFHGDIAQAIGTWRLAMEHARAARTALPADSWFDLSYEGLLHDPESALRGLCDYLGEDFDPAMLEPAQVKQTLVPERKTWHANTAGPLLTERAESWRRELEPADVAFLEAVAGGELRAAGYATGSVDGRPEQVRVLRFGVSYRRRRLFYRRAQARDARSARREPNPVASMVRS